MDTETEVMEIIGSVLKTQKLAVLATYGNGHPYTSLIAFTVSDDLKTMYFATLRQTRKYVNLSGRREVSLLVDTRKNSSDDFSKAIAITVTGNAHEPPEEERDECRRIHLSKHPELRNFVFSAECAMIRVSVSDYHAVSGFQNVQKLSFRS